MRTLLEALKAEIHYPLKEEYLENRLMIRGLDPEAEAGAEILPSPEFTGAVADCLFGLIDAIDFSESDISISLPDRDIILRKANYLYRSIGEKEKNIDQPTVRVGPPEDAYVSY